MSFAPYIAASQRTLRTLYSASGTPLKWRGQEKITLTNGSSYESDWVGVNFQGLTSIAIELLWSGDVEATATLQGKIDKKSFEIPIDLTGVEPDGTTYSGDIDSEDPESEDLGHMPVDIYSSPPFTHLRLKLAVTGGSGFCRGNVSASTPPEAS